MQRDLTLVIQAKNMASRALRDVVRVNQKAARDIAKAYDGVEKANRSAISAVKAAARATKTALVNTAKAVDRSFGGMFTGIGRGFRSMVAHARRAGGSIRTAFGRVARGVRALFSLPSLIIGGTLGTGAARAIGASFEMQRLEANLRAIRSEQERAQIREFAEQRGTGMFRQPDVLAAAVAGRRLSVENWMRLTDALRGTAAANGNLAEAVTAVQRAMFEGEAELAERYGLLLREQNLTEASIRLFNKKATQLTAEEKAYVVYTEALRQSLKFQDLENEMLQTTAGRWQVLKNRFQDWLLVVGERLQPALEAVLNLLTDANKRAEFWQNLKPAFVQMFYDIGRLLEGVFDRLLARIVGAINTVGDQLRGWAPFEGIAGVPMLGGLAQVRPFGSLPRVTAPVVEPFGFQSPGLFRSAFQQLAASRQGSRGGVNIPGVTIPGYAEFTGRAISPTASFAQQAAAPSRAVEQLVQAGVQRNPALTPLARNAPGTSRAVEQLVQAGMARSAQAQFAQQAAASSRVVEQLVQRSMDAQKQAAQVTQESSMSMLSTVSNMWDQIASKTKTVADNIVGALFNLTIQIIQLVQMAQQAAAGSALSWIPYVGVGLAAVSTLLNVGEMQEFQTGGIVQGRGAQPAIVHGGEAVFTQEQLGGLASAIQGMADRPVVVQINGREVARSVRNTPRYSHAER